MTTISLVTGASRGEEIIASDPTGGELPKGNVATFSYRVSGFSGAFGLLAQEARGTWRFEQVGSRKTEIEWTYTFVPKGWLASVPLLFILATFWRSYMQDGIENVRRIAEDHHKQAHNKASGVAG